MSADEQPPAAALRARVIGTWRRLAWKRQLIDSSDESDALGPDPFGYINDAPDGRVMGLRAAPRPAVVFERA